jgi:2-polyprenyl-6-methoxyphenol hydroxylase-like FAD-dependent oxidoreductase
MQTDVLIVGAGPTGLAFACQLIRYGVDFVIIDKKETTTPHSKAIGVQARTLEIYEQFGLAEKLIADGAVVGRTRLLVGGEVRGGAELAEFGKGMSPYPFLLIVEQGIHERHLHDIFRSNNMDVHWQTELQSFEQNDAGVSCSVRSDSGETKTIDSKFVVACDGASSSIRQDLGLTFRGGTLERLFYVADVRIDWGFSHEALHVCLSQNTITAFFPMPGEQRWRIVGTFPEGHEKDESEILYEEIERQIIKDTELELDITDVNWFSVYKVHSRAVNKFSKGRIFLAGDSAHIHSPAGAQGMNTGIQDGYNLAWKLAMVLKRGASTEILNTYNEERLPNARRLLRTTDRFFQFGSSPTWYISFLRTKIFPRVAKFALNLRPIQRFIFPTVSQIGINYRGSSISENVGNLSVKAGDRMPYFLVDGKSIYDRIREPSFHLLIFEDGSSPSTAMGTELDGLADVHVLPLYPNVAGIFGTRQAFTILLRPDNYIAYVAPGTEVDGAKNYLKKLMT